MRSAVIAAVPKAVAVSLQSGWPTPVVDVIWNATTARRRVAIFGVTAPYQVVQDYRFDRGRPLTDIDVSQRTAGRGHRRRRRGEAVRERGSGRKGRFAFLADDFTTSWASSRKKAGCPRTVVRRIRAASAADVRDAVRATEDARRYR